MSIWEWDIAVAGGKGRRYIMQLYFNLKSIKNKQIEKYES